MRDSTPTMKKQNCTGPKSALIGCCTCTFVEVETMKRTPRLHPDMISYYKQISQGSFHYIGALKKQTHLHKARWDPVLGPTSLEFIT